MFNLSELRHAQTIVNQVMPSTPQYRWPLLCAEAGCDVWLKHENHTPTGAFKVRGGLVYLQQLKDQEALPRGLITATRGNHGQSIPFAARRHNVPVTVLAPRGNSREKNEAMVAWGADLIEFGDDFDAARIEAARLAEAQGLQFAPSFHPTLVLGVATYALELFTAVESLDAVYVPIGMGSGICGVIAVRDLLGLSTEVVGVVSSAAAAMRLSWEQGEIVETETAATFADGMACRVPNPEAFAFIREGAASVVEVDDASVAAAMRSLFRHTHNVVEGAGAAAYAALLQDRERLAGRRVAAIVTGGNVDSDVFRQVLAGETPSP